MNKNTVVQKYGGTSLGEVSKIMAVAGHIKDLRQRGTRICVIVSAMGEETDRIIELINGVNNNPDPREYSQIVQTGEVVSAGLLAIALNKLGVKAKSYTAAQVELITTNDMAHAKIKKINARKLSKALNDHVVILAGFQGISEKGSDITTLGRGGSDATAVAVAAALKANVCEIYTDVDGVYTVDPRIVKNARRFKEISYMQMIKMGYSGAGVMMPRSIEIASEHGVPVRVMLSPSFGKTDGGTIIKKPEPSKTLERISLVQTAGLGIQTVDIINISDIKNIPGIAATIFSAMTDINIIDECQTGAGTKKAAMTIVLRPNDSTKAFERIKNILGASAKITSVSDLSALTLVDEGMPEGPGYLFRVAKTLSTKKINREGSFSADKTIGVIVKKTEVEKTAIAIAEEFNLIK